MGKPYVCTLDKASLKKAREELNEIPSDRMAAIQALREWVQQQPHLKLHDMEDWEYLMFLRGAKFSQLRARQMIDGNLTIRSDLKHWCCDVDSRDPKVLQVLREGYLLPLPKRTKDGCQLVINNLGAVDPNYISYTKAHVVKAEYVGGDFVRQDELTQVHGLISIIDFSKYTLKHLATQFGNAKEMKKYNKLWQTMEIRQECTNIKAVYGTQLSNFGHQPERDNNPGRLKMFHIYKPGTLFEALLGVLRPFLKKKFLERVTVHETLESLYKHIPMELLPEEYLPDDYEGPTVGTLQQIQDKFIADITSDEFRNTLLNRTSSEWKVDESKRPNKVDVAQHSFRKLNVD